MRWYVVIEVEAETLDTVSQSVREVLERIESGTLIGRGSIDEGGGRFYFGAREAQTRP